MSASDRKSEVIIFRVSGPEHVLIKQKAEAHDLTVSEYVRCCAFDRPLIMRADHEALMELRRQGGLIKHLASIDRQNTYAYRVTLNLIQETLRRLTRDRKGPKTQS